MNHVESQRSRQSRIALVDRGTPMGEYQRRFWHPIAALVELDEWPVRKVSLLGEDLALFRTENGTLGLVSDRCPHRGASLSCGMTDGGSLRCALSRLALRYLGPLHRNAGRAGGQQAQNAHQIASYPVQEMAGLLWAYLGAAPAPLLPRFEHLVREDWECRHRLLSRMPCNWLQVAENTLDPLHIEHLHMKYTNYARARLGERAGDVRHHAEDRLPNLRIRHHQKTVVGRR